MELSCLSFFQHNLVFRSRFYAWIEIHRRYVKVCNESPPNMGMDEPVDLAIAGTFRIDIGPRDELTFSLFDIQRNMQTHPFPLF